MTIKFIVLFVGLLLIWGWNIPKDNENYAVFLAEWTIAVYRSIIWSLIYFAAWITWVLLKK